MVDQTVTLPALVTVRGVEVFAAGWEWHPHTVDGRPVRITAEDLVGIVAAAQDPRLPRPILKLGHVDPSTNGDRPYDYDAVPARGRLARVRLSDDAQRIVCDVEGVPAGLAYAWATAYPHRSVELDTGSNLEPFYPGVGNHDVVLRALSLLGETDPALPILADLTPYLGFDPAVVDSPQPVTASVVRSPAMPEPAVSSAVTMDEIVDRIYDVETSFGGVVDVIGTADGITVVYANADGLWLVPVEVTTDDEITLGEGEPARHAYEPTNRDAPQPITASLVPSHLDRSRAYPLIAAALGRTEPTTEENDMPITREALDALTDEERTELGLTLTPIEVQPATAEPTEPADENAAEAVNQPDEETASLPSAIDAGVETVTLTRGQYDQLTGRANAADERDAEAAAAEREQLITAALGDGRLTPHEATQMRTSPLDTESVRAATGLLVAGRVPTTEVGHGGTDAPDMAAGRPTRSWFPELNSKEDLTNA